MAVVNASFTAVGNSSALNLGHLDRLFYSVSGTFSATVVLERTQNNGLSYETVLSTTSATSGTVLVSTSDAKRVSYRFRCSAYTSGTAVVQLLELSKNKMFVSAGGLAKVGATAGFVVAAGDNISLVTCPASQTGSTLVLPLPCFKVGGVIQGFHLVGQVESGGNAVTIDAALRVMTAAAADVTDGLVGSITQVSVTADTILSEANSALLSLNREVKEDESYYLLITATTGASTDIALQGVQVIGVGL